MDASSEDSPSELDGHLHRGLVPVAHSCNGTGLAGHLQLVDTGRPGFRMRSVEPDAFTPATGYPAGIRVDGIPLRDRVWLEMDLR